MITRNFEIKKKSKRLLLTGLGNYTAPLGSHSEVKGRKGGKMGERFFIGDFKTQSRNLNGEKRGEIEREAQVA